MIDRKLLLHDFDETARRLARKGVDPSQPARAAELLASLGSHIHETEATRALIKATSKEIGGCMRDGDADGAAQRKLAVAEAKERLATLETTLKDTEVELDDLLLRIPNLPADDVPDGASDADNVELRREGPDAASFDASQYRPHWEVAGDLGLYDGERGAKIAGSMFAVLRGDGARLLRALVQLGLDLNRDNYTEIIPPHFVNSRTFTGTGQLPKFADDSYRLQDEDLWAIPTGEVPIMGLHQGEVLDEAELPLRYMAYTTCFRKESGSAGKDTRGMQRLHEFHKVELVKLCTEEQTEVEFAALLADAERPLQLLELPYRVLRQCTGDLPFSATRMIDLDVYAPGVDRWLEVASVGQFTDFQSRRGNIRYRPLPVEGEKGRGKPRFTHAMNGSGLATPRVWSAVIEHGQQPDGSVRIPEVLVPYMGTDVLRPSV